MTPITKAEAERLIRVQADAMALQDLEALATVAIASRVANARQVAERYSIALQTPRGFTEMLIVVRDISVEEQQCVATVEVDGSLAEFTFAPSTSGWLISGARPLPENG